MSELINLVYVSRATFAAVRAETGIEPNVARILAQSRKHNPKREIGGVLYYGDGNFFQCLEGERAAVEALFARIKTDPRHTQVEILAEYPIEERMFRDWSMKYVPIEREVKDLLRRNGLEEFDPYRFGPTLVRGMVDLLQGAVDPTGANNLSAYLATPPHPPAPAANRSTAVSILIVIASLALLVASAALMVALGLFD